MIHFIFGGPRGILITGTARDPAIKTHAFEQTMLCSSAPWPLRVVARREYVSPPANAFAIAAHLRMDSYISSLGNFRGVHVAEQS